MQHGTDGNHIIVRLEDGDDILGSLREIVKVYDISSGMILSGLGMIRDFEISFFDKPKKQYNKKHIAEACELLATQGSIAYGVDPETGERGDLMLHLHCTIGKDDHTVIGGHLNSGTCCVLNEICILKLSNDRLSRKLNPDTGLFELQVQ